MSRPFGFSFFTRRSDGSLCLISYHPRKSGTWHWAVTLTRDPFGCNYRTPNRRNQWHDYYRLPFGYSLLVSRQDYHKQDRTLSQGGKK